MIHYLMGKIVYGLLPTVIFAAWLVAEFRWRRSIRIGLGLGLMLFLLLWIYTVISAAESTYLCHQMGLRTIDRFIKMAGTLRSAAP